MTPWIRRSLGLAAVLVVSACASSASNVFSGDSGEVVTLRVRNQQLQDARVYIIVDRQRARLGSVRGNETRTFRHPIDGVRTINIEFDITLGARCVTRGVSLGPEDAYEVTIPGILTGFDGACGR